jgi:hypothetical protein
MKISLNLATNPSLRDRYALAASAPTAGIALLVLILLTYLTHSAWVNYKVAQAQTADDARKQAVLQQKEAELRSYLGQPKYSGTFREVKFVNALIAQKKLSVPGLFAKVTELLPVDVRLIRLLYAEGRDSAAVRMEVNGRTQGALDEFLSTLEKSPDFADAALAGEGFDKQNSSGTSGGVTMNCQARYLGAAPSLESEDQQ